MKSINVYFEDEEFTILQQRKGSKNWHDYILELGGLR